MALLGTYVGIIPVLLGMLLLPSCAARSRRLVRVLLAVTVGLLAFLAVDAPLEGIALAERSGAGLRRAVAGRPRRGLAYLLLTGVDRWLRGAGSATGPGSPRRTAARPDDRRSGSGCTTSARGWRSARPTRSASSRSAPSWSSASRSTTRPRGSRSSPRSPSAARRRLRRLPALGLIAGAPAILGAVLGASVDNPELSALPARRRRRRDRPGDRPARARRCATAGRAAHPAAVGGIAAGRSCFYLTGLLVSVLMSAGAPPASATRRPEHARRSRTTRRRSTRSRAWRRAGTALGAGRAARGLPGR